MNNIEKIGKEWKSKNGSIRYYVNDWKEMIGLYVSYHNTGNVSSVSFRGESISNCGYNKHLRGTKVWVSESGEVHIDYCGYDFVENAIKDVITKKIEELNASVTE
ncbi:MAG: hypothetical protein RSD95_03790 [Clostridia bacterium]